MTWAILYAAAGLLYLEWQLRLAGRPEYIDPSNPGHLFAWYAAGLSIFIGWPLWLANDIWRKLTA